MYSGMKYEHDKLHISEGWGVYKSSWAADLSWKAEWAWHVTVWNKRMKNYRKRQMITPTASQTSLHKHPFLFKGRKNPRAKYSVSLRLMTAITGTEPAEERNKLGWSLFHEGESCCHLKKTRSDRPKATTRLGAPPLDCSDKGWR